jgi:hypothetical protein
MVLTTVMPDCERGEHDKCPGGKDPPPADLFGGIICDCSCHSTGATTDPELEKIRDKLRG